MPSRRKFLAGASAVSATGVAGCLNTIDTTTGLVWNKSIIVEVTGAEGRTVTTDILNVTLERGARSLHGEHDPEYAGAAIDDRFVTVPDTLHKALANQFRDVRYHAGVTSTAGTATPVNAAASQSTFNELTLGGRASVSTTSGADGYAYLQIHDTEPRSQELTDNDIASFDLSARVRSE